MTKYGFVTGWTKTQISLQIDVLLNSGLDIDGGIVSDKTWIEFLSILQHGDEVIVVAESRLGATAHERQCRKEMLKLIGVRLHSLTRDFQKGDF